MITDKVKNGTDEMVEGCTEMINGVNDILTDTDLPLALTDKFTQLQSLLVNTLKPALETLQSDLDAS